MLEHESSIAKNRVTCYEDTSKCEQEIEGFFFSLNDKNKYKGLQEKVLTTDKDPFMGSNCDDCEHTVQKNVHMKHKTLKTLYKRNQSRTLRERMVFIMGGGGGGG